MTLHKRSRRKPKKVVLRVKGRKALDSSLKAVQHRGTILIVRTGSWFTVTAR